jgi:hypothetical protein
VNRTVEAIKSDPLEFAGTPGSSYERHLVFDKVEDADDAGLRTRFEAIARSVRDNLAQRWLNTDKTYAREDPKRVYYLSMEFLIGRSLANNVMNLLLDPVVSQAVKDEDLDWLCLLDREPDAGLGNGGLGRLAACFLDSMATMGLPAMGYGLRYEYGIFKQTIVDGWQREQPDNWLRHPDPWEVARPREKVEVKLNSTFEVAGGRLRAILGKPSPGSRLRRQEHQHAPPVGGLRARLLRFSDIQPRRFRGRRGGDVNRGVAHSRAIPGRLDHQRAGAALRPGVLSGGLFPGGSAAPLS